MVVKILTCSISLLEPRVCCEEECDAPATLAVLHEVAGGFCEHTRCAAHPGDPVASKPLILDPLWDEPST